LDLVAGYWSLTRGDNLPPADLHDREEADCSSPSGPKASDGCIEDGVPGPADEKLQLASEWFRGDFPFLTKSSLRYFDNLKLNLKLLVCTCCEKILDGSKIDGVVNHVRKKVFPPPDVLKSLKDWLPTAGFIPNEQVLEVLLRESDKEPQIAVPIVKVSRGGFSCPDCRHFAPSRKVMDNHIRRSHERPAGRRGIAHRAPGRTDLQPISVGKVSKYFPVQSIAAGAESVVKVVDKLQGLLKKLIAECTAQSKPQCNPTERELAPFIRCSRFYHILNQQVAEGTSYKSIKGAMLMSSEEEKGVYGCIREAVLAYLEIADNLSKQVPYALREEVPWKGTQKNTSIRGFRRHLRKKTIAAYANLLSKLVLCLVRSACNDANKRGLKLIVGPLHNKVFLWKVRQLESHLAKLPARLIVYKSMLNLVRLHNVLQYL
jgi:hypothetical protein